MKKILTLAAFMGIFCAALRSAESAGLKIATINMEECLEGYHKFQENKDKIDESMAQADEALKERSEALQTELKDMEDEIQELLDASKSPVLSKDAKTQKEEEAQQLYQEYRQKKMQFQQHRQELRQTFQRRYKSNRDLLADEIKKAALDVCKEQGVDLFLDSSDMTGQGFPAVLYADPAFDITDDVLKILNTTGEPPEAETEG